MTKKLEELFNLDEKESSKREEAQEEQTPKEQHKQIRSLEASSIAVEKITGELPQINDLDALSDKDLDTLAQKAEQAHDDLMDLGMNVEVRYSGRIFEVASSMLKNAIDAKTAKVDKKLKSIDLKLKKLKIDKDSKEDDEIIDGKGYVMLDRNELMKKLSEKE